jgi:hypothetical protein
MSISILPDLSSSSGLSTISDLYKLIGGGTTTKTESSSLSQAAMDAMWNSASSSTNGTAALSSGQRGAGGYNSVTNELLNNKFKTDFYANLLPANTTKTSTTNEGGITGSGTVKVGSFLAALQAMEKLKKTDVLKGLFGQEGQDSSFNSYVNPDNSNGNPNYYSSSSPSNMTQTGDLGLGNFNSGDVTDFSSMESIGIPSNSISDMPAMNTDPLEFLNGMKDGGEVSIKKSDTLSSQYNVLPEDASGSIGVGENVDSGGNIAPLTYNNGRGQDVGYNENSAFTQNQLGQAAGWLGLAGAITGNQPASSISSLGQGFASSNPVESLGVMAANIVSGGLASPAISAFRDPSFTNLSNVVGSIASPVYGAVNGLLGFMGQESISQTVQNAVSSMGSDNPNNMSDSSNPMSTAVNRAQDSTSGDRATSGDPGMANGGYINAPGDGTVDTKLMPVAGGEFVFSKDVVDAIGLDKLKYIQAKYHTPVAVQKLRSFA